MFSSLVKNTALISRDGDCTALDHGAALAKVVRRLAAVWLGLVSTCGFAVDAGVQISEGRNPLLQSYMVKQVGRMIPRSGNAFTLIEPVSGLPESPFFTSSEPTQCRENPYRFCRDLSQSEFRLTSLRFLVPEVPGLSAKSLTIRRNSVVANYSFR